MLMMMTTSTMMLFLKHPLSLGFNILGHTLITCIMMGLLSPNFWFSYILILIMIGGLLVLFIYMTSIASNEKFKLNYFVLISFMFMMFLSIYYYKFMLTNNFNNELINNMNNFNFNLNKFLTYPNSNIFIMIMFYLLITMIAIVKITKLNFGPLRQFKYDKTFTKM